MNAELPYQDEGPTVISSQLFNVAPMRVRLKVANVIRTRFFLPGEQIVISKAAARDVGFVLSGLVQISYVTRTDGSITLVDRRAGELIGVFETAHAGKNHVQITAREPTCVGFLNERDLRRILERKSLMLCRLVARCREVIQVLASRFAHFGTSEDCAPFDTKASRLQNSNDVRPRPWLAKNIEFANDCSIDRGAVIRELTRLKVAGVIGHSDMPFDTDTSRLHEIGER